MKVLKVAINLHNNYVTLMIPTDYDPLKTQLQKKQHETVHITEFQIILYLLGKFIQCD